MPDTYPESSGRPCLIVMCGLPGTGKSHVSKRLSEKIPLTIIESDRIRKDLFPSPSYTVTENACLFSVCHSVIRSLLGEGKTLIFDATNLRERSRNTLRGIARQCSADRLVLNVVAPSSLVKERLKRRMQEKKGYSDADWSVYTRMRKAQEKIKERHFVIDTSGDIEQTIETIVAVITGR